METSEKVDGVLGALFEVQQEIEGIPKDATNTYHKNRYATLESVLGVVKPVLNAHGLLIVQAPDVDEKGDVVVTTIWHVSTQQFIRTSTRAYCKKPDDPQALGSGITYTKRYAIVALLALPTIDDDGNAGAGYGHQYGAGNQRPASQGPPQTGASQGPQQRGEEPHFSGQAERPTDQKPSDIPGANGVPPADVPPADVPAADQPAALSHHQKRIMGLLFQAYCDKYQADLMPHEVIDKTRLLAAVREKFEGKVPTRQESIPRIMEAIGIGDVVVVGAPQGAE
jgi:hypothetical protein